MNYSENMKPKPEPERPKVDIWPILKYLGLSLLGFIFFCMAAKQARLERGYSAMGGEAVFLFLPLFYYLISKIVRDWLDDLRNKNQ